MRYRTHVAAAGTVLLAAAVLPQLPLSAIALAGSASPAEHDAARQPSGRGAAGPASAREGSVAAADLLAKVKDCARISKGLYRTDDNGAATVPVCGAKGAVFWQADMDIDCDGQVTAHCNSATDRWFQNSTAFSQSDGKPLNSEKLPYVVVPAPGGTWDYTASGINGGGVAAVIHDGRVQYAVVGDTGPAGIIGEASYATAAAMGIPSHPERGGVPSGVTYILFKDSRVSPIEDHAAAVRLGDQLAKKFLRDN